MAKSNEPGTGLTPDEKKFLNEEGFEGGVAVIVGKKDEVERARQRLETEGRAENLETYVRMHKKIVVPSDFLKKEGPKQFHETNHVAHYYLYETRLPFLLISFIDSQENIAEVLIKPELISSLKDVASNDAYLINKVEKELEKLGFIQRTDESFKYQLQRSGDLYRMRERDKETKRNMTSFDF